MKINVRNTLLINFLLVLGILVTSFFLKKIWEPSRTNAVAIKSTSPTKQENEINAEGIEKKNAQPSLASYKIIGKNTIFRPDRKEWVPPPPPKPAPKPVVKKEEPPPPPPPDPLPEPTLLGIIIGEDETIALMQGHSREKISVPENLLSKRRSTRTRSHYSSQSPRYRIKEEKMGRYHIGDTISEAKIIKILKDRVVLERDGKVFQVLLRDQKKKQETKMPEPFTSSPSSRRRRRR